MSLYKRHKWRLYKYVTLIMKTVEWRGVMLAHIGDNHTIWQ